MKDSKIVKVWKKGRRKRKIKEKCDEKERNCLKT
jgi:hypothetical protein